MHIYPYTHLLLTLSESPQIFKDLLELGAELNGNFVSPFSAWYSSHFLGLVKKKPVLI